eukprot:TRINITY_DN190_c0_g1_i4.p1 TRINITY_DN190_c0_g1~~TRINITY_DN190_c0_g1_i4.p1  ORF type:complete len:120 (+),score=11.16 TRINITY_DN190_c0_g1_i4:356-715(+)
MSLAGIQALLELYFSIIGHDFIIPFYHLLIIVMTYGIVCSSLVRIAFMFDEAAYHRWKSWLTGCVVVFIVHIIIVMIFATLSIPEFNCYNRFSIHWKILTGELTIACIVCTYFGARLTR